ncbi:PRAME family member 12-like [Meriones unguiculatus]|uniref:PRAME family member 12-like n=1 Tax=Meriones unguiculatus TaxID=10047 RepID=UPI00293E2123|nr:PRAME family member 12-like [Meriones unguiculatus]
MCAQTPPTLLKLARQALLRDETLDMSALDKLPMELLPALFKEALTGRHTMTVKAMVAAWPFPCLPVGALMKTPDLETLQAVLAGVDMELQRKIHSRRRKLQVLDLSKKHHEFWSIWAGAEKGDCSAEAPDEQQVVKVLPRYALRRLLKVVADLWLRPCFHAEHIETLELMMISWDMLKLSQVSPFLGWMRNLRKFFLANTIKNVFIIGNRTTDREENCIRKFISQFYKLDCLQYLSMNGIYFLRDHLHLVLGCLMAPLETLSITSCNLSQSDLNSLSECPKLFQLKHLDLKRVCLMDLDVKPLQILLENVADTLQSLDLESCWMMDSHLQLLISALSKCTQLANVSFYDNDFSMHNLTNLLQHTANLSKMNVEQYPAPLECHDELGYISIERFTQLCAEQIDRLRAIRQPKCISFATLICSRCG